MFALLVVGVLIALLYFLLPASVIRKSALRRLLSRPSQTAHDDPARQFTDITPLQDFDWKTQETVKLRPFKPKFHLTMGLENCAAQDMVLFDKTYLDRLRHRRDLIDKYETSIVAARPGSEAAVTEQYKWLLGTLLPKRYPSMFSVSPPDPGSKSSSLIFHNHVTDESFPLDTLPPIDALKTLGRHIDCEFLVLRLSPEDDKYHLEAFVTCFPSGFSTREKLGLPLAGIHRPVPGYSTKLEKSMDRFFASVPVGKIVRRSNWSVTTNDQLFCESGNHFHLDEKVPEQERPNEKTLDVDNPNLQDEIAQQRQKVHIPDCRLRCERQTLHRLPETKALVFSFQTYLYRLEDVKAEGSGEALAEAIEGLTKGSVPDVVYYKRGVVWGDEVVEYLRS